VDERRPDRLSSGLRPMNNSECTSRPECPCEFCESVRKQMRKGKSRKQELDDLALKTIDEFRVREHDARMFRKHVKKQPT
jgi:hypothetical protein